MNTKNMRNSIDEKLKQDINSINLIWPTYPNRYAPGDTIDEEMSGVFPSVSVRIKLRVERFIGGGFAGQVYKTRVLEIQGSEGISGLNEGEFCAVKIGKPPSGFAVFFRNLLYRIAFQAPFAQLHRSAARAGLLWQKMIRRGLSVEFGTENTAVDVYAGYYDKRIGAWADVNEWVDGRNWIFEIDDDVFHRKEKPPEHSEFLTKKDFMNRLVKLCHDMGAHEFARQYEWWTAKSQPNVLKRVLNRKKTALHTAIDFRAGLVLLPLLPMSPADFKLIFQGLGRGKLVQFDRGDLRLLGRFIRKHQTDFQDIMPVFEELKQTENEYRSMLPDITWHGIGVLTEPGMGRQIVDGLVSCWEQAGYADSAMAEKLKKSPLLFGLFSLLEIIPVIGRFAFRICANTIYRQHIWSIATARDYSGGWMRVKQATHLLDWHREERRSEKYIEKLEGRPFRFWIQQMGMGWLPAKWHRFFIEPAYAWDRIKHIVTYPLHLYFDPSFREQWLLDMIEEGEQEGLLSIEEADHIRGQMKEPYIQVYLKALAVHVCTLPITQVISIVIAVFAMMRYGNNFAESMAYAAAVLAFFQLTPVSPGSLVRGAYVIYLMFRDKSVKNYWIAALVSFWHYIGYLGFPLQMVTKYPALARFMAGRWATNIVHIIPVFGERGALLEYGVFDLFFNIPISMRSRFRKKRNIRIEKKNIDKEIV